MTENHDVLPILEVNQNLAEIKAVYYDVEFDVNAELERGRTWFENGECPGPTSVGKLEVPTHLIEELATEIDFGYMMLDQFPSDEFEYGFAGRRGDVDDLDAPQAPLSSRANAILHRIREKFTDVIEEDLRNSSDPSVIILSSPMFSTGIYRHLTPTIHIDMGTGPIRYIATIAGPPTEFVGNTVEDPSLFDNPDNGLADGVTLDNPLIPVTTLEINRFIADADPHTEPVCEAPTFRLFGSASAK